jgi:hypothetical protein
VKPDIKEAAKQKVTETYARFYTPGAMFADTFDVPCAPDAHPDEIRFPENAYAFDFYRREDVIDGENTYRGKERKIGKRWYHPDSYVLTLAEVKGRADPRDRILIGNMECNGWPSVIFSRWGNWPQPFDSAESAIVPRATKEAP